MGGDLGQRILFAIPAAAYAIFIVAYGEWVFPLGLLLIGLVCLHELYAMYDRAHPARLAGFAGVIGMVAAAHFGDGFHVLLALCASVPLTFVLAARQPRGGAASIAVTLLGVAWIGLALAHATMLRELDHGGGVIVAVAVGTFLGDTGAYVGGRALGQTKLAPSISPNKTVEGLLVGMVTTIVAVQMVGVYQDGWMNFVEALLLGIAVAVLAPLGDLFESYLKRDAGTKDTGTLFGPHGGALDRMDAVLFSVVGGYFVWVAIL